MLMENSFLRNVITSNIKVWANEQWTSPEDLSVGDKIISFNPNRNCTEYSHIQEVRQEYTWLKGVLGIKGKNMRIWYSPDHPIMLWKNGIEFPSIEDHFMRSGDCIIARPFETYKETADIEDVRWAGRYCAMFSRSTFLPGYKGIWSIIKEVSGYEAQEFLQEFYRWNILIKGVNWQKSSLARNKDVRDIMFHVAPRAGVGVCWWPLINSKLRAMRITTRADLHLNKTNYGMKNYEGNMFDLRTVHNNFLVRYLNSVFLIASSL